MKGKERREEGKTERIEKGDKKKWYWRGEEDARNKGTMRRERDIDKEEEGKERVGREIKSEGIERGINK